MKGWTLVGWREPQSWERNQGEGPDRNLWPVLRCDRYPLLEITRVRAECTTRRGWCHATSFVLVEPILHATEIHAADTCEHWKAHAEIHGWDLVWEPVLQMTVRRKPFKRQNKNELFSFTFDEWMEYWDYDSDISPSFSERWATTDPSEIITAYEAWIEAESITPEAENKRRAWNRYMEKQEVKG